MVYFQIFSIDFDEVEDFGEDQVSCRSFFEHQSMGHTFYLPGKCNVGALIFDFGDVMFSMFKDVSKTHWGTFPLDYIDIG